MQWQWTRRWRTPRGFADQLWGVPRSAAAAAKIDTDKVGATSVGQGAWDYGAGAFAVLFGHASGPLSWALDVNVSYPIASHQVEVEGQEGQPAKRCGPEAEVAQLPARLGGSV